MANKREFFGVFDNASGDAIVVSVEGPIWTPETPKGWTFQMVSGALSPHARIIDEGGHSDESAARDALVAAGHVPRHGVSSLRGYER